MHQTPMSLDASHVDFGAPGIQLGQRAVCMSGEQSKEVFTTYSTGRWAEGQSSGFLFSHCSAVLCLTLTLTHTAAKYSCFPFRGKTGQNQISLWSQVIRNIWEKTEFINKNLALNLQWFHYHETLLLQCKIMNYAHSTATNESGQLYPVLRLQWGSQKELMKLKATFCLLIRIIEGIPWWLGTWLFHCWGQGSWWGNLDSINWTMWPSYPSRKRDCTSWKGARSP